MRFVSKALCLLLVSATETVLAQGGAGQDGYIGYNLKHRGDPESAIYETENSPDVGSRDPVSGGVVLAKEPDVYLNASVYVGEIDIQVDNITAKINLDAQVLKLLHFNAGVDASIDRVRLLIQNVTARVELEARLENVVQMVDDVLHSIDLNPIVATLGQNVNKIVNETVGVIGSPVGGGGSSAAAKRDHMDDYNLKHNILYSINNYQGQSHTNRVLAQDGSIYDVYLNNDGDEQGRQTVGSYATDMTFNGHNRTINIDGSMPLFEQQYVYKPFHGLEVTSWIYMNAAGKVTRTQVISETTGGGSSTISNDDEEL